MLLDTQPRMIVQPRTAMEDRCNEVLDFWTDHYKAMMSRTTTASERVGMIQKLDELMIKLQSETLKAAFRRGA